MRRILQFEKYFPYLLCFVFFIAYAVLSVTKHNHFLTGYDLAVSDQGIWLMSKFLSPISTPHAYPFTSLFSDHVEIIYALLSPLYWFQNDVRVLIILQSLLVSFSAIPVYLLARKKQLNVFLVYALLISFLTFYGIQNALWSDVHSLAFAAAFLPWFIYFLEIKKWKLAFLFFFLLIFCKEDIAMFTFLVSAVFFIIKREKIMLLFMALSVLYVLILFGIYYPYFTPDGYRFQNEGGLFSNLNMSNMYNTPEKRDVLFYSFAWFGFIPFLAHLHIVPAIADIAHYFVLGSNYVTSAQSIFLHYRVTLAILLIWPTIIAISKYKKLNNLYVAGYILLLALLLQYHLHLPLSYLVKQWFWKAPSGVQNIQTILKEIPGDASLVTQVNITPHVNHRKHISTLWPKKKEFPKRSPCGEPICDWFYWPGDPEYLLADTSPEWDARHLLTNNAEFKRGVENLEKAKVIRKYKQKNSAVLYKVNK